MSKFLKKYLWIILVLLGIIIAVIVLTVTRKVDKIINEYKLNDVQFYQYDTGHKFTYTGSFVINKDNEVTKILIDNKEYNLTSSPLFIESEDEVFFPKNMMIVFPITAVSQYKINYYATLTNHDNEFYIKNNNSKEYNIQNCFLYDGDDLYYFIEDTDIIVGNDTYHLYANSYVILHYNESLEMYNFADEEGTIINIGTEDIYAKNDNYNINISVDSVKYGESSKLLLKKFDYLKNYQG